MKIRLPLPAGSLGRARLGAVFLGGLAVLGQLPQLGNPGRSAEYLRLSAAAILLLLGMVLFIYRSGRAPWWTSILLPVLVVIGASGLKDPLAGTAFAVSATMVLSLYVSTPSWFVLVAGAMTSVPFAVAISPYSAGRIIGWDTATVLSIVPQVLLMSSMMRGIYLALHRQDRAAEREAELARCGRDMLGVTDAGRLHEIARRAGDKLVALQPGIALLILRPLPDGGLVVSSAGGGPGDVRGRAVGDDVLTDPALLAALVPGHAHWTIDPFGTDPAAPDRYLAVGGRRRVPTDVLDTFRNLSLQVLLGEGGCRAHAELEHAAHHDHLTQLPTRAKFLRAVGTALTEAPSDTVAVLNIDLDDFKQVNDRHGHTAGDELLVQVASALTEAAGGRGLAGRFGGDEFALLLTGLGDPAEADDVARQLVARLAAPMRLSAGTVHVGASIGVAVAELGITVADLTRRADTAMYAAKASGKNRIEIYTPPREQLTLPGRLVGSGPAGVARFRNE
ncbi:MAG TPA: GGDEF domain-containing protein [Actinoplanes sp.]